MDNKVCKNCEDVRLAIPFLSRPTKYWCCKYDILVSIDDVCVEGRREEARLDRLLDKVTKGE